MKWLRFCSILCLFLLQALPLLAQDGGTYTVQPGDTVYRIARQHNLTIQELRRLNDLGEDNLIRAGMVLRVRSGTETAETLPDSMDVAVDSVDVLQAADSTGLPPLGDSPLELKPGMMVQGGLGLAEHENISAYVYPDVFEDRMMASGHPYAPDSFQISHPDLPFETLVILEVEGNDKGVIAIVADRGPGVEPRSLEVSRRLAQELGLDGTGTKLVLRIVP